MQERGSRKCYPSTNMRRTLVQLLIQVFAAVAVSAQTPSELPVLSSVQRELKGGETHSYRISLNAGQFLYAVVEQQAIDVETAVFGPDGKQLSQSDSPNDRYGTEPVVLLAANSGEYRVEVRSPNTRAPTGHYAIRIIASRQATPADKGHAAAQMMFDEARKMRTQPNAATRRAMIAKYRETLPLFEAAGDNYRRALALLSIGDTYYRLNEFREALDYFNQTLALTPALGDKRLEAGASNYAGGMLDILADVGKALNQFQRALKLAREVGWQVGEATALSNIGKIYSDAADWQKALDYYSQALAINKLLGNKRSEALTLNNIGIAYSLSGEQEKALDYLQQSLPLLRDVGDKDGEAYTIVNIGRAYGRMNEFEKALDQYRQAQVIQKQTGNRAQEGETLDEIGASYAALGQHKEAAEYHRQAIEILRSAGNLRREALALTNLGEASNLLNQPEKALEQFNQALAIIRSIDASITATALEGVARAEAQRGNLAEARKYIAESLTLIETVRTRSSSLQMRASYRASVEKAYEFYIDVLMQQHAQDNSRGYDAEALQASERGRARSLLEHLSEARVDIRQGVDSGLIEKERDVSRELNAKAQREMQLKARKGSAEELATVRREISTLEDEYQQVQATIRQSSPQYAALTQPHPLGLKEIQQQLDADTLLLEYSLGQDRSYLWAVGPGSLKSFLLPKQEEIEKVKDRVYQSLTARSVVKSLETPAQRSSRIAQADRDFEQAASELSRMILAPVASELGNKRLVIVADGALQYVPFAALPVSSQPLIVGHEVISLASASAFAVQRQNLANRPIAPKTLAVIADPVFSTGDPRVKNNAEAVAANAGTRSFEHLPANTTPGAQLSIPRLPFTRWEADRILAVARTGSNLKALDFRANRAIATSGELSKYRYVHFATHGYLDTTRAGLSAIVLSLFDEQGRPQDGFLRTHDVYNLKLPAELVVLSACETGLGKDVRGEGLEGLTRGFMYAGARRVVVSLWNVNDKATAALMQRLYTGMLRSNKTPAAALRAAQIEMLRTSQWQSPYYWAAFVMQGEWR